MSEEENKVRLGEGISDGLKSEVNQEILDTGKKLINILAKYIKGKIQEIDLDKLLSKKEKDEIISLWSCQLAENGYVPKGYAGLPDNLLIDNMHQDGYLSGLYVGYTLAMMSLVDNNASNELIISVRDEMRPNLFENHYNDRDNFYNLYKSEKYNWVEKSNKNDYHN